MKNIIAKIVIAAAVMAPAFAHAEDRVDARRENQQDRIAQGVKSGQLTAGETARLENKEAKLNHEIRHDRRVNGGNLTNKEKAQINRQQNRVSEQIYDYKHNARKQ